uniref:CD226 molecule n=1 Tax=Amphilophus citrinellus TaxID=61819 RepID=A0A3Q0QQ43_AMPCI
MRVRKSFFFFLIWYNFVMLTEIKKSLCPVAVQQRVIATVRLEEGMVLDCLCPWDGNLSMVSWTKLSEKNPVAVFHPEFGVALSHRFQGRVDFLRTTPMDGSISIRNVTHQDIGLYYCSVQTFPQGPWTKHIQLSSIILTSPVIAEQNSNLTIECNHQHNGTVNQVVLEKMLHGQPWRIIGVCKKTEGGLVGEDYSDRGRISCADSLDMSLQLTQVTQEDDGFYRCTFNTDAGQQTTTVQLTTVAPGTSQRNKRKEYRVKLHPSQGQVGIASFILSTLLFTLDTFKVLPYLLIRLALNYKAITLYS